MLLPYWPICVENKEKMFSMLLHVFLKFGTTQKKPGTIYSILGFSLKSIQQAPLIVIAFVW